MQFYARVPNLVSDLKLDIDSPNCDVSPIYNSWPIQLYPTTWAVYDKWSLGATQQTDRVTSCARNQPQQRTHTSTFRTCGKGGPTKTTPQKSLVTEVAPLPQTTKVEAHSTKTNDSPKLESVATANLNNACEQTASVPEGMSAPTQETPQQL